MSKKENNNIVKFLKLIYVKLFQINDTSQRISLGLGIGVFCGIMPGMGPVMALFLALLTRVNRASALLGSLLTNTWLSFVTFFLSIQVGSAIMRLNWQDVRQDWIFFIKDFHWLNLLKLSILKVILPVIVGYFVIAFGLGVIIYLITFITLTQLRHENKSRVNLSR